MDSRYPIHRNSDAHVRVDFSTSRHFYRDFRVRGIANPDVNGFRTLIFPNFDARATYPPLILLWPTQLSRRDIAFRDSNLFEYPILKTSDMSNSDFV
jgi:hypothetical protein